MFLTPEDEAEVLKKMRAALKRNRGYADFFSWPINRDLEEHSVLVHLFESMARNEKEAYKNLKMRGRGSDPPDAEATDSKDQRVALEVTELVDGAAIQASKHNLNSEAAEWGKEKFLSALNELLRVKDGKFEKLLDSPYLGGYVVVIFTDEPLLPSSTVQDYLDGHVFSGIESISEAYFLVSYDPSYEGCPYFQLNIVRA